MSVTLGVNLDHIATLREARKIREPDPVAAAVVAELAGADGITVHLRADRRHIQERDVRLLRQTVATHLTLQMATSEEMVAFAVQILPDIVTLVPESSSDFGEESGLDVAGRSDAIAKAVESLRNHDIAVAVKIAADTRQVKAARKAGAQIVELDTGAYANAFEMGENDEFRKELSLLQDHAALAQNYDIQIAAGGGLNYRNVRPVAEIAGMRKLEIGHAIVGRAVLVGLDRAVREMKALL